jgi:hypothetical protein
MTLFLGLGVVFILVLLAMIGLPLIVVVLVLVMASNYSSVTADFRAHAVPVQGRVVRVLYMGGGEYAVRYLPVVTYYDPAGRERTSQVEVGVPEIFQVGQEVALLCDPRKPSRVRLAAWANRTGFV